MTNNTHTETNNPPSNACPAIQRTAAHRTFRFRADNKYVAKALLWMLVFWAQDAWIEPDVPDDIPLNVQITLAEDGPSLEELRWLFQQLSTATTALATLKLATKYDGARQDATADSFIINQPRPGSVARSRSGLHAWARRLMDNASAVLLASDSMMQLSTAPDRLEFIPSFGARDDQEFSDNEVTQQDTMYFRRRLPYATKPGSEHRTFRFRVEFEKDLVPLFALVGWAAESAWQSVDSGMDTEAKFTLREDTLTLDEVRWLFDRIIDCHVAVQTLSVASEYTGERSFEEADDMGAKPPKGEALKSSLDGLNELHEYYSDWVGYLDTAGEQMELELG
jgi:hypothetical protein